MRSHHSIVAGHALLGALLFQSGHAHWQLDDRRPGSIAVVPESSLVVTAGSTVHARLLQKVSVASARPGDTVYLQVVSPLVLDRQVAIAAGAFIEGVLTTVVVQQSESVLGIRFRRLVKMDGSIADIFAETSAADGTYRRGAVALVRASLPSSGEPMLHEGLDLSLVMQTTFGIDRHRALVNVFGRPVRFAVTPPRLECYTPGTPASSDVVIFGTPPTPAIGDFPGTPGTPDITVPGARALPGFWQPCN